MTEVSDNHAFVFLTREAVAILQHKACGCRAGNVINLAAASKWLSTRCVSDLIRAGCLYDHPIVFTGRKKIVEKKKIDLNKRSTYWVFPQFSATFHSLH